VRSAVEPKARTPNRRRPTAGAFEHIESKLHPPEARAALVPRARLLDRVLAAEGARVVSVIAPPGYGKTTFLAQWAARSPRPSAWVSVDRQDNDPAVFLTYLAIGLDRIAPLPPRVFRSLASPDTSNAAAAVAALDSALSEMTEPVSLVLDHVEVLENQQCIDAMAEIAIHLPPNSQLAFASRGALSFPSALLRAQGQLEEVGVLDLAMDEPEARALLEGAGMHVADDAAAELIRRTEGWPAGLYLAALASRAGGSQVSGAISFSGDDRFMADYLRSELLSRLSRRDVAFLTRTAVLDRMSGPLCDAVLGTTGSGRALDRLEGRNLLVMALDRRREWFRYHHLFRDLLLHELRRRERHLEGELRARAAEWFEANGLPEAAVDHAQLAGDTDRVARLVLTLAQPVWASGRLDTLLGWMEWFEAEYVVDRYPELAVHGALIYALLGRPGEAERWTAAAEREPPSGRTADGSTMIGLVSYLRALLCRGGLEVMRRDARTSWDGLISGSPYRATMLHTEALSYLLEGDPEGADAVFARAFDAAVLAGAMPLAAMVLAERCEAATERGDWAQAGDLADRAAAIVAEGPFDHYWTSAIVYAWAARVALHRGDLAEAREHVGRAARLRPLLTYALPVVSVQALLHLARAYLALGDPNGALVVLRQVQDILQHRPRLGDLTRQAAELRTEVEAVGQGVIGASALTNAELRLVPFLSTHLSFREIGERLYVSRHTVKSQAMSIYRKLGVSSRSQAIQRMHETGLLAS
jgi:LuxR family transcriptional regulator, maltose regulon positive regulatory protein